MNVKVENANLRFKISEDELKTLLDGHLVHTKVALLDKTLVVTINPSGRGETMEPKLVMDEAEAYLNLLIPQSNLRSLFDLGQNKDGLKQKINSISVTLQVDMKDACHA